jgi:hypothetical protein
MVVFFVSMVLFVCCCTCSTLAAEKQKAVVATVAADYSSGALSVIDVDPIDGPRTYTNDLNPTLSDTRVVSYGSYFYRIESFMADNIAKFDIQDPTKPLWQYATMDADDTVTTGNPYDLVVASPDKAYLLRYGTTTAWIVNPQAASQEEFKIGTLDLSDYADADGLPEMNQGVIIDGKLFILMQRLNRDDSWKPQEAYVAVFDTRTDTEIDTWQGEGGLKGIRLPVKNPGDISYVTENKTLYVQGSGLLASSWSGIPAEYTGGIVSIDPDTYQTTMLVDDGSEQDHPYGNISGMLTVNATKGYFVGYQGFGNNTVYSFNPSTGEVQGAPVDLLKNISIPGMEAGGAVDTNGLAWVTDATNAQIVIVDPADDSVKETVPTNLNPNQIAFVTYEDGALDITANGLQGPLDISNWKNVSLALSYSSGDKTGQPGEWWVVAWDNESNWYSWQSDPDQWVQGIVPIERELSDVSGEQIYSGYLPVGSYTFFFLIDYNQNGMIDDTFVWDSIDINVTK